MKKKFILVTFFAIVAATLFGQTDEFYWDTDYTIYPNNLVMNVMIFVDNETRMSKLRLSVAMNLEVISEPNT